MISDKFWFVNHNGEIGYRDGHELVVFAIWIDFWAVDVTILNFTVGFRIK